MSELAKGLTNLRSLRAAVRELTLEQAESALEKLQTAVEEKRANEAELIKAETERKERLAKYKELMEKEFKLKVTVAKDPVYSVINGIAKIYEDFDKYSNVIVSPNMEY